MPIDFADDKIRILSRTIEYKINDPDLINYIINHCKKHDIDADSFFNGDGIRITCEGENQHYDDMVNYIENRKIESTLNFLQKEVLRLKEGKFSPEELQNLCHNLTTLDRIAFLKGCKSEQEKLFGKINPKEIQEIYDDESRKSRASVED